VTASAGNSGSEGLVYASFGSSCEKAISLASTDSNVFPTAPLNLRDTLDGTIRTTRLGHLAQLDPCGRPGHWNITGIHIIPDYLALQTWMVLVTCYRTLLRVCRLDRADRCGRCAPN
jgi:hypothetical protein